MPHATIRLPAPWKGGQDKFFYWSDENPEAQVLVGPCGTKVGKAIDIKEVLPTPEGFKTVEKIAVGDLVFSEHGQPIKVTHMTPVMHDHDCFEVVFSDGNKITCDAGHLWTTYTCQHETPKVFTTREIKNSLTTTKNNETKYNHKVACVSRAVEFTKKLLPLDPYSFGTGLDERKNKTRIPDLYLTSSPLQRLSLLQGIMDTKGSVMGDFYVFESVSLPLMLDVASLCHGFGMLLHRTTKKDIHRLSFQTDLLMFTKKENLKPKTPKGLQFRKIVAVIPVDSVPVKCITVDNPTSLFLVGKGFVPTHNSFGSALWLTKEALVNPGMYCVWVAPTYLKCKIGYRYMKAMMNVESIAKCVDGLLEIRISNGSFIKFLHGSDAEVTIEGEAVDRFIIDEAGKINKQVWHSLLTTITQTGGIGIITGTPRGFNWYYDVYRQAKSGNPFFCHVTLKTEDSPFVKKEAIARNKSLIPKALYDQYYNAMFVSSGSVFGDLTGLWDESYELSDLSKRFWVHPDASKRTGEIIHGMDIAKKRDFTVIFSVNTRGETVGFVRFRNLPYPQQAKRLELYLKKYFNEAEDNFVRFDETGVGTALGDMFAELDLDCSFSPVIFSNRSKSEMVTRLILAIEQSWLKVPRIELIEHELASYEMAVTKSGLYSYNAPDGEHDDIVSAMLLAVSQAYQNDMAEGAEKLMDKLLSGEPLGYDDAIMEFASSMRQDAEDFFDDEIDDERDEDFDFERK